MGDLNVRFGTSVRNIPVRAGIPDGNRYSYPVIPDPVERLSYNVDMLSKICIDHALLVVNDLKFGNMYHERKLIYRIGDQWISELDVCLVALKYLIFIRKYDVHDDNGLPSDHALISVCVQLPVVSREWLLGRARGLGDLAVVHTSNRRHLRKSVKFIKINVENFLGELSRCYIPDCTGDVNVDIDVLSDMLHKNANTRS